MLRCGLTIFFFFQAEDGIRDLVRSRGLGDVYKRQPLICDFRYLGDFRVVTRDLIGGESGIRTHVKCYLSLIHI